MSREERNETFDAAVELSTSLVGLDKDQARTVAEDQGFTFRALPDDPPPVITLERVPNRLNATYDADGVVVRTWAG